MKVAMVYPLPSPVSPQKNCALSIIYPGRAAEDAGHDVSFWDARLFKETRESELALWEDVTRADVIAISSLSGYQLSEAIPIARKCREKFPGKPIIWGGVHVTFETLGSLREKFVDFCVLGEGEVRFPKLLKAIETGKGFRDIDGIGYKKTSVGYRPSPEEDFVFENPNSPATGIQLRVMSTGKEIIEMHDPDGAYENGTIVVRKRGLAVDLKAQYVRAFADSTKRLFVTAAARNEVILQTARGCNWSPTSCEFCSVAGQYTQYDSLTGKTSSVYRYIPYELWAADLLEIHKAQPFTFIELEDENSSWFLKDWRYAELLQKLGIEYHLHLRSDQLQKEETIAKLAATGCIRIHIGAESGNEATLAQMRKNESVEDHYIAARMLAKHGIEGVYTWIVGNPGESDAAIMDTLRVSDEVRALHPRGKSRATIYVLMPLPGTLAYQRAKKEQWPLPTTMEGWTELSAASNPNLPKWLGKYLYFIAGFHHNRYHKTMQNFPGWWRMLILPFEWDMELRWLFATRYRSSLTFNGFALEFLLISQLLKWRSKKSIGQSVEKQNQLPKLIERLIPGMAGH